MFRSYFVAMSCLALLSACADTANPFNQAPFDPTIVKKPRPKLPIAMNFKPYSTSTTTLQNLSDAYEHHRNDLLNERPFFDLPAAALGIAGVANVAFDGAKAASVALGLTAAAGYGVSSYFGLTAKITVYTTAFHALSCAADVSANMDPLDQEVSSYADTPSGIDYDLQANIVAAQGVLTGSLTLPSKPSQQEMQNLLTAQNNAVTTEASLSAALLTLSTGNDALQTFAYQVVVTTDGSVLSNEGNAAQLVSTVQSAVATAKAGTFGLSNAPLSPDTLAAVQIAINGNAAATPPATIQSITANLTNDTVKANQFSSLVTKAWTPLATCLSPAAAVPAATTPAKTTP